MDNETWVIEVGGEVTEKTISCPYSQLSNLDKALYCFYLIDYSVRNSGTLGAMKEIHPTSINELLEISRMLELTEITKLLNISFLNEKQFCDDYYSSFESVCTELRQAYENR